MNKYVIIVAGGKGLRMGYDIPKQFILLKGKPILMHTIERFYKCDKGITIIVVLPTELHQYWAQLCSDYRFTINHLVEPGGATRFDSVKNGLNAIHGDGSVAIHDGVRPFVSDKVIAQGFNLVLQYRAAIPVINVIDSLRHVTAPHKSSVVNRDDYKLVQTPQFFDLALIQQAYSQSYQSAFTDDASVVEAMGHAVHLFEGNRENIKLTTPFDLTIANSLMT